MEIITYHFEKCKHLFAVFEDFFTFFENFLFFTLPWYKLRCPEAEYFCVTAKAMKVALLKRSSSAKAVGIFLKRRS